VTLGQVEVQRDDEGWAATLTAVPTEAELFRFSAISWLAHRIHYDREFARSEGHRDLVVHGPLQGALLGRVAAALAATRGATVGRLEYRHRAPAFCGDTITVRARLDDAAALTPHGVVEIEASRDDGTVLTSGTALLRAVTGDG